MARTTRGNLTFLDTTLFGTTPGGDGRGRDSSLLEDPTERSMLIPPSLLVPCWKNSLFLAASRGLVNSFYESYSTYSASADVLHLAGALEKVGGS